MKIFVTLFLATLCLFQTGVIRAKPAPQSRDTWRSVRTNNLFIIGNADAEKLRQVAAWLEFFHSSFARLVSRNVLNSSVPTTVIIFRDDASFTPFKPLYQGRPANLAGFFQAGNDVNYIALSLDPSDRDPFSTAFHEYVHLHLQDNLPNAPVWLNEGLAELYGSLQFSANEALLGVPIPLYLRILREHELLPLATLFSIASDSPHYNEQDKSGIFYGESWALVHYLMLGERGRQEQFKRFLHQVGRGESTAKAIEDSFGVTMAQLEDDLRAYVRRGNLSAQRIGSVDDPQTYASYTAIQRSSLTESEANYYLGDLLLHIGRESDAERYFKQSIALDPSFLPAYAVLGQRYVYQRRYDEAKKYLQKATSGPQSYLTHYLYAYVLGREDLPNVAVIREQLLQAIKLAPNHAPSHYLLAVVDFVSDGHRDEAMEMALKAQQLAPGNKNYADLVERIKLGRSGAARQTRDSVKDVAIAEPVEPSNSRLLGGASSGMVTNDGRTIQTSGSLPTADELIAKYKAAVGGAAAIKAITSRVVQGTIDIVGVTRGERVTMYAQAPDKVLLIFEIQSQTIIKRGYNGRTGWERTAAGLRTLNKQELAAFRGYADFYDFLPNTKRYSKITVAGRSKIGYRDVYVVDVQEADGTPERLYFEAQSFQLVRIDVAATLGTISGTAEIYLDDWREVEGVKYPFSMSVSLPKLTVLLTVNEIKQNVPLDPKLFDPQ